MKEFIRNFKKQKVVGILNIGSLSLGIMVFILIYVWASKELTMDNFHEDKDRMYRVLFDIILNQEKTQMSTTHYQTGELMREIIPEAEDITIFAEQGNEVILDKKIYEVNSIIMAEYNFFHFFTFPLKYGDKTSSFAQPGHTVIDESTANRLFPGKNAIGEFIKISGKEYQIVAVMYDIPKNSHLRPNIVISYPEKFNKGWGDHYNVYVKLFPGVQPSSIEPKLKEAYYFHFAEGGPKDLQPRLEAMKDIYFNNTLFFNSIKAGDKKLVMMFILIASIILIISCINFTNLFVSTSFIRAKNIGIKKSAGAENIFLMRDFMGETFIYVVISVVTGLLLSLLALPIFNRFVESDISLDFTSPQLYIFFIILIIITTLLAGSYPSWNLTRFGVIETLRGRFSGKKMSFLQKALIVIQFTSSIFLLIVVLFFDRQIKHILAQDLGLNTENVIYLYGREDFGRNFQTFREEFKKNPDIIDVTMKLSPPHYWEQGLTTQASSESERFTSEGGFIKENYFDFMEMEIIKGENPFYMAGSDHIMYCVINERTAKLLDMDDPVGKTILVEGEPTEIRGVIKNIHSRSLHHEIHPQIYLKRNQDTYNHIFFKINGHPENVIKEIEKKWKEVVPDIPFRYEFLDDSYRQMYRKETDMRNILEYALLVAFVITVAGLFAIAFYTTQQRRKEIGIRKVNGATVKELLVLLNKEVVVWIFISFILACPVAYWYVQNWLENFTARTNLSIFIFLLAGIIACGAALLTVSYQTWKTANANPVDAIRIE